MQLAQQLAQPLLGRKKQRKHDDVGSTIAATVVNLLKNMVGAGLLNVCIAFHYASVFGGVLVMIYSACVCTAGFLVIGYCCSKTNARSFRELWRLSMGAGSENVVDAVLFFHCFFSCVGYITMIGDFSVKSATGLLPGSIWAEYREASMILITLVAILPLTMYDNLDSLKHTSVAGLVITCWSCAYIFYDVLANANENDAVRTLTDHAWYVKTDMFKALALFNGSFSAHYNAPTYYAELKDRSFTNYLKVTLWAFSIATLLFTAFGLAGFARFGDQVLGNVLKSYGADDPAIQASWFFMTVSTVFNFPHAFQRMRTSWNALFNKGQGHGFLTTTFGLLGASLFMGIFFHDIAVIKMIKGATLGVSIMFIFPALFFLKLSTKYDKTAAAKRHEESPFVADQWACLLRALCFLMMVTGLVQGLLALMVHCKLF